MKTEYFKSESKERHGMSCADALKAGIVRQGQRLNMRTGNLTNDGWECVNNGCNYRTQTEALNAHFAYIADAQSERNEKNAKMEAAFAQHRDTLASMGLIRPALRDARRDVFDAEEAILSARDAGQFTDEQAEELIDAYGSQVIFRA